MGSRQAFPEIDLLKAVAIVCVVMIHAGRPFLNPHLSAAERTLAVVTQFAVPCFLMCSGFLYASPAARWATTGSRLRRLLVPYLIAGVLAGLYRERLMLGQPVQWLRDMLLGHTFGAYYYVFVIFTLILATPIVARMPALLRLPLGLFLVASGSLRSVGPLLQLTPDHAAGLDLGLDPSFPWHLRHPLLVWGYFFVGWELRLAHPWLTTRLKRHAWPRWLSLAAWLCLSAMVAAWASRGERLHLAVAGWPHIYLSLALLVLWTFGRSDGHLVSAWLSRRTYFIYLYHLFFVIGAERLWAQPRALSWTLFGGHVLLGLAGPVLLALLCERWLPPALQVVVGLPRGESTTERAAAGGIARPADRGITRG